MTIRQRAQRSVRASRRLPDGPLFINFKQGHPWRLAIAWLPFVWLPVASALGPTRSSTKRYNS